MGAISSAGASAGKAIGRAAKKAGLVQAVDRGFAGITSGIEKYQERQRQAERDEAAGRIAAEIDPNLDPSMVSGVDPEALLQMLSNKRQHEAIAQRQEDLEKLRLTNQKDLALYKHTIESTHEREMGKNIIRANQAGYTGTELPDDATTDFRNWWYSTPPSERSPQAFREYQMKMKGVGVEEDPNALLLDLLQHGSEDVQAVVGRHLAGKSGLEIPDTPPGGGVQLELYEDESGNIRARLAGGQATIQADPSELDDLLRATQGSKEEGGGLDPQARAWFEREMPDMVDIIDSGLGEGVKGTLLRQRIREMNLPQEREQMLIEYALKLANVEIETDLGGSRGLTTQELDERIETLEQALKKLRDSKALGSSTRTSDAALGGKPLRLQDEAPEMYEAYKKGLLSEQQILDLEALGYTDLDQ